MWGIYRRWPWLCPLTPAAHARHTHTHNHQYVMSATLDDHRGTFGHYFVDLLELPDPGLPRRAGARRSLARRLCTKRSERTLLPTPQTNKKTNN